MSTCPYNEIRFQFEDGLKELPNPATCKESSGDPFSREKPRKMTLFDWHGECIASDQDDVKYRNFWTHLEEDLRKQWKRKRIAEDQATE